MSDMRDVAALGAGDTEQGSPLISRSTVTT